MAEVSVELAFEQRRLMVSHFQTVRLKQEAKIKPQRLIGGALIVNPGKQPVLEDRVVSISPHELAIQVQAIGLCRTDLRVFDGTIPVSTPLVPGHEFAGVVVAIGDDVASFKAGDRVVVNPVYPCGRCNFCEQSPELCQQTKFLGVGLDGACRQFISVPESAVFPIPDSLSFREAAFAEPVAASLAVLNASIKPENKGVLLGSNRISELTMRILSVNGFNNITRCSEADLANLPSHTFDFAIETMATTETINHLIRCLKPNGTLVLKSRQQTPIELTLADLLPKRLRIECVNYGPFSGAIELLASGRVSVKDLVGTEYALSDFELAFAQAAKDEQVKTFIVPNASSLPATEG